MPCRTANETSQDPGESQVPDPRALAPDAPREGTPARLGPFLILWGVTLLYVCAVTVADPDLWGHTLYGLRALEQGVLTEPVDPFSYTAWGSRWVNHEWLTEYQYGWLWKHAGGVGLWMWRNSMVLIVWCVVGWVARRRQASLAACTVLFVYGAESLAGFCTFVRPQLATFALFALTLAVLRDWWRRPACGWIWMLPVVSALWVNLHGGYLAGLGLQLIFLVAAVVRWWFPHRDPEPLPGNRLLALLAVGGASAAATLINPYGITLYTMLWDHLVPKQAVREWQPLWGAWQSPMYYVPFVLLLLALWGSRRWRWIDLLVLLIVGYQAVSHIRHVALLCIAAMLLLPEPLSDALPRLFPRLARQWSQLRSEGKLPASAGTILPRRWVPAGAFALLLVGILALELPVAWGLWSQGIAPWQVGVESTRQAPGVPRRAVDLIASERLTGNLITEYSWGQYVIWHLFPACRVAFDGRYRTVYPPRQEEEYLAFLATDEDGPPRVPLLDDYPSEMVLLAPTTPVCRYLATRADWARIYEDQQAVLYLRRLPRFQALIERAERNAAPADGGFGTRKIATWHPFPGGPAGAMPASAVYPPVSAPRSPRAGG